MGTAVEHTAARPPQFFWGAVEGDGNALQERVLRLHVEVGDAVQSEDLPSLIDALAAKEALFSISFTDFEQVMDPPSMSRARRVAPVCGSRSSHARCSRPP